MWDQVANFFRPLKQAISKNNEAPDPLEREKVIPGAANPDPSVPDPMSRTRKMPPSTEIAQSPPSSTDENHGTTNSAPHSHAISPQPARQTRPAAQGKADHVYLELPVDQTKPTIFEIPKETLLLNSSLLLDHDGIEKYTVQTKVTSEIFEEFLRALNDGSDLCLTPDNFSDLSLVCEEFGAARLKRACDDFEFQCDENKTVVARIGDLEREVRELARSVDADIQRLKSRTAGVVQSVRFLATLMPEVNQLNRRQRLIEADTDQFRGDIADLQFQAATASHSASVRDSDVNRVKDDLRELSQEFDRCVRVPFPMKEAKSLDGVISYLAQKYGGNVQEKGIVTITSKSVFNSNPANAAANVVDLTSTASFWSKYAPWQWLCWDFGEIRLRPTHYTIKAHYIKSWVVERSLDGERWTEIDRQTDNQDFTSPTKVGPASFAVSNPAACRFIRLTQTARNHRQWAESPNEDYRYGLSVCAVEFFGTLSETRIRKCH